VAYDLNGVSVPVNQPRFEHRVPDVTVTNLLTGNQSDGGDTLNPELLTLNQRTGTDTLGDTTGFTAILGDETLSSSTTQAHSGTKSLKCVTDGSHNNEGVYTSNTTVTASTIYVAGVWVYAPAGATMIMQISDLIDNTVTNNFTATGSWQYIEGTITTDAHTTLNIIIKTRTTAQAITFYVDDLRLATNVTTGYAAVGSTISVTGETSYQGYRSIKCITANSAATEGVYVGKAGLTVGASYSYRLAAKIPLGVELYLYSSNTNVKTVTGTGEWQEITATLNIADSTTQNIGLYTKVKGAITFYVDYFQVETTPASGVASNWAYGGSSYSSYKTEYGCLVEESKTNLLTANVSTGTDSGGDTTGFAGAGEVAATISSSTTQALQGTKSLKVVTSGTGIGEGVSTSSVNIANTTAHTQTIWIHAPTGSQLKLTTTNQGATATAGTLVTGNGAWQLVTLTGTSSSTSTVITIATVGSAQAITFYIDMLQLTATAYPLSWTIGGSTQAAETLTAPTLALGLAQGTIELETYINPVIKTNGTQHYLINSADGSANNQTILLDDTSNNLTISTKASAGATTVSYADSNFTLNTWLDIASTFNATNLKLFTAGTSRGTPSESPNLPATQQTVYLGSKYDGTLQANTLIRNVTFSRDLRSDTEVTSRSNTPGFGKDRQVTLHAPLQHDLKAVRVRR
jgi:hypothetical protein